MVINDEGRESEEVVSFKVKYKEKLKFVGKKELEENGYKMFERRKEMVIWEMVSKNILERRNIFLNMDEDKEMLRNKKNYELK